ncbi:MAG: GntG family PLP-dependent aldolase [Planctomycetota bacterium]|nr:GntG family PLP-dependent aldolase [Planctomycetota bacterium]
MHPQESPADFRSDTVTQPSSAMREAMAQALVGDDVLDGDPSVQRLERLAAQWLGKEGALYVPSGTMANQIAMGSWTRPGDEVVVQRYAHVTTFEAGATGALHGLQTMTVGDLSGSMDPSEVEEVIRPVFIHCPKTALICMEQTHNMAGGRISPMSRVEGMAAVAQSHSIPMHLDGARLANAVVATGIAAPEWCQHFDSVALCLSKGLGAPVGSIIAGSEIFLERARVMRKRLGGWMRQAGHLAEAARIALEQNVPRLAEDHALAKHLARALAAMPGLSVDVEAVESNIVMVVLGDGLPDAAGAIQSLEGKGVRVSSMGPRRLRLVTHMDVGDAAGQRLLDAMKDMVEGR